jgi:hypothetical protein
MQQVKQLQEHAASIPVTMKATRKSAWGTCSALLKGVISSCPKRKYAQTGIKVTNVITTDVKMYGTCSYKTRYETK